MNKSYFLSSYMFFIFFHDNTRHRVSCAPSFNSLSALFIFFGLSSSSAAFSVALVAALPTAQSLSQPQHVSRRWLELGQRWSIAGEGGDWGWCGCRSVCLCVWCVCDVKRRRTESQRAALIALSLFVRSFGLFARLLWLSFYFGLHCGFVAVVVVAPASCCCSPKVQ